MFVINSCVYCVHHLYFDAFCRDMELAPLINPFCLFQKKMRTEEFYRIVLVFNETKQRGVCLKTPLSDNKSSRIHFFFACSLFIKRRKEQ